MNRFALVWAHSRIQLLDLFRSPGYVVPTLLFPAMFYGIFDLPYVHARAAVAASTTLAFIVWAVAGVALYQFGVGIAQERGRPWERYLRTLPVSETLRFSARIVAALVFALLAAAIVALVARLFTPIALTPLEWLTVCLCVVLGGVPFVFFGIAIGYWASARAAVPIATALNLLLAYAGGLWMPPEELPRFVQTISPYLPTRAFADLLWSVIGGGGAERAIAALAAYGVLFALLASLGYRRDERTRYA